MHKELYPASTIMKSLRMRFTSKFTSQHKTTEIYEIGICCYKACQPSPDHANFCSLRD